MFSLVTPCSGELFSSSDKCDKLVNGTNVSWLKVPRSHYNMKKHWCDSFAICFQSQKLQKRCLTDFMFYNYYFKNKQAFTFEISTYFPGARVQVNYGCGSFYFAVNIIRCRASSKNKGIGRYNIHVF